MIVAVSSEINSFERKIKNCIQEVLILNQDFFDLPNIENLSAENPTHSMLKVSEL